MFPFWIRKIGISFQQPWNICINARGNSIITSLKLVKYISLDKKSKQIYLYFFLVILHISTYISRGWEGLLFYTQIDREINGKITIMAATSILCKTYYKISCNFACFNFSNNFNHPKWLYFKTQMKSSIFSTSRNRC